MDLSGSTKFCLELGTCGRSPWTDSTETRGLSRPAPSHPEGTTEPVYLDFPGFHPDRVGP